MNKSAGRWNLLNLLLDMLLLLLFFSTFFPKPKEAITQKPPSRPKIKMKGILYLEKCYYKKFDITAYTVGEPGVNYITASGRRVNTRYIACPKSYKFGTKFVIWGKDYYCYDRGELINKYHRLDIFLTSRKKARKFGIKRGVKVEICKKEKKK